MTGDLGLYGERLAVALGFVALGFAALVLFVGMSLTCRTFTSVAGKLKLTGFTKSRFYQPLYKLHGFFWYGFFLVLILHKDRYYARGNPNR